MESVFVFVIGNLWTMSHSPSLSLSLSLSALSDSVKACGAEALALLGQMKQQDSIATADSSKLKAVLEAIRATAEVSASRKFAYRQNGSHWAAVCRKFLPAVILTPVQCSSAVVFDLSFNCFRNCVLGVWSCSRESLEILWSKKWLPPLLLLSQLLPG